MIGDPTESRALGTFFGTTKKQLYIGSVKTNIGHLEAAAGVAALIKVLLMMKHSQVVPSLWYSKENENPKLKLSQYGFVVPTSCVPWKTQENENKVACVNSFGFGGTNAHAIVEQFKTNNASTNSQETVEVISPVIAISAYDENSLKTMAKHLSDRLDQGQYSLVDVAFTSTCKRDHKPKRKAFSAQSIRELRDQCQKFITDESLPGQRREENQVVFVFCGVGTTWTGMAQSLLKHKTFEKQIQTIDRYLEPLAGWKIWDTFSRNDETVISDPLVSHVAIFAYQVSLAAIWEELGVIPNAVVGQSVGEVAAAHISGVIDLETAVRIIYHRSKILSSVTAGTMAVIKNCDVGTVELYCKTTQTLSIAVYSSPVACVVSGEEKELRDMESQFSLETNGRSQVIFLGVKCAYHSSFVEQAAGEISVKLGDMKTYPPTTSLFSTVTGEFVLNGLYGKAEYWARNVRCPVLFSTAIQNSRAKSKHTIFLEIGPSPVLMAHINAIFPNESDVSVVASVRRNAEGETLAKALCTLYEHRLNINWEKAFQSSRPSTDLPIYIGKKFKQLYQSPTVLQAIQTGGNVVCSSAHPYLKLAPSKDGGMEIEAAVDGNNTPYVYEHIIGGQILLPGAYYGEIGFEIGKSAGHSTESMSLSLEFLRPVRIENEQKKVLVVTTEERGSCVLFHALHDETVSCRGTVKPLDKKRTRSVDIKCIEVGLRMSKHAEKEGIQVYDKFNTLGFSYGKSFRMIKHILHNASESLSEVEVPEGIMMEARSMTLHPCILDVLLQTTILTAKGVPMIGGDEENRRFLPVAIEEIWCLAKPEKHMFVHTQLVDITVLYTVYQMHFNMVLSNTQGNSIVEIKNFMTYSKRFGAQAPSDLSYELRWLPTNLETNMPKPNVLLLTSNMPSDDRTLFENESSVTLGKDCTVNPKQYVADAFRTHQRSLDAIILFVKSMSIESNVMGMDEISIVYNDISQDCQLLIELLRYVREQNINRPVYIVTENTQISEQSGETISCKGAGMWGFVRSANIEFIADMVLVDLQPSMAECKNTLLNYISTTFNRFSETLTEITIKRDRLFKSEFAKVSRYATCSSKSLSYNTLTGTHALMSDSLDLSNDLYLLPTPTTSNNTLTQQEVTMQVTLVTVTKDILQPQAALGRYIQRQPDTFDSGSPVFALEYRGFVSESVRRPSKLKCQRKVDVADTTFEGQWESVALFPSFVCTKMHVPKKHVVSLQDIPFYQPGLLVYGMILWKMASLIPAKTTVFTVHSNKESLLYILMERMFLSAKQARLQLIHDVSDISENDAFVSLESVDRSIKTVQRFKHIVCLQEHVSIETLTALRVSKGRRITVLDVSEIFEEAELQKELPKLVKWFKANKQAFVQLNNNFGEAEDDVRQFPCKSLCVMTEKSQYVLPAKRSLSNLFRKSDTYVITGGLTGLGWELTKLMAEMGAGTIATMSRRELSTEIKEKIRILQTETGCKIKCLSGDVSDMSSVRKAFLSLRKTAGSGQISGIFHCAGVTKSKLIINMTAEELTAVLKPKVLGTMHLHLIASEMSLSLEYFVVASSISSFIGSAGQTNYSAANSFMDAFVTWRRQKNLPGQAINWGALKIGMAAEPELADMFFKRGFNLMPIPEIRSCFQTCLMQNSSRVVYADMNWDIVGSSFSNEHMKRVKLQFANVIKETASSVPRAEANDDTDDFNKNVLKQKNADERMAALLSLVKSLSSKALGCDIDDNKVCLTLAELPFDSMSTVTFINILHQKTGYRIPSAFMMNTNQTLINVAEHLYKNIF